MFKWTALVFTVALAAPAYSQGTQILPQATPAPTAEAKAAPGEGKLICVREEEIGTRLGGRKVCKTQSQWDEERRQARDTLDKVQQMGTANGHSG